MNLFVTSGFWNDSDSLLSGLYYLINVRIFKYLGFVGSFVC